MTFWQEKSLVEMSEQEWESLCDGCGKCCLHKLQDADTDEILYTNVACRMLDLEKGGCKKYADRKRFVANCVLLKPDLVQTFQWMPSTCAYRLIAEGKPLYDWHPLVSGSQESVHAAGQSVLGRVEDEREAGDFEDHIVDWPA